MQLVFVKDEAHRSILLNDVFCTAIGHRREELIGKTDCDCHPKEEANIYWEKDNLVFETGGTNVSEEVYTDANGDVAGAILSVRDITELKRSEQECERLISELQDALAKVRILSGMLPICAPCRKIRDDQGYWNQIEAYSSRHSQAEFSHSFCPGYIPT